MDNIDIYMPKTITALFVGKDGWCTVLPVKLHEFQPDHFRVPYSIFLPEEIKYKLFLGYKELPDFEVTRSSMLFQLTPVKELKTDIYCGGMSLINFYYQEV